MKKNQRQAQWIASALSVVLSLSLALPTAAQKDDEEEVEAKLASELSDKLDEIDDALGELAKVEKGEKNFFIADSFSKTLDGLASHSKKIKQHFDSKGDTKIARAAEKLGSAVKDAQRALEEYEPGESQKPLMAALEKVQDLGEAAVGLVSPNN